MRRLIDIFIIFILICVSISCGTIKQVPMQTIEKVVYRDSVVYVHDSITVKVPFETVKEVLPDIDTSYLKTSIAESVAYLDTAKKKLHHTLTQNGEIKTKYDTIIKIEYEERLIEREIPVEVEKIKYKRDALFWVLAVWAIICIIYGILKINLINKR